MPQARSRSGCCNDRANHRLPVEIILVVIFRILVEEDFRTACPLALVSKAVHSWIIPLLYTTVLLRTTRQIERFFETLRDEDAISTRLGEQSRLLGNSVRRLWIGPTVDNGIVNHHASFTYWSSSMTHWPITMVHQILMHCTSLQSLAVIELDQNKWRMLESAVPASLKSLWLGPVHGPLIIKNFLRGPHVSRYTSIDTYMRDDEVVDIVLSPHTRVFRRIFSEGHGEFALHQLPCVKAATGLREMILEFCYGEHEPTLSTEALAPVEADSRIKLVYQRLSDISFWHYCHGAWLHEVLD
ncbi:hypothetical protein NEOLEDRAFT_528172 [Neolentinus lepideus HHB14362 ss-1]|uniref:F-box domain-containing protein n=1 Tax=Neolentinus lepideus HHB14362 ss-1 TaxID=1314782 RepID=A0A165RE79_9AGAM|nr:hypothetical protein NEOLEDRAFT_528172 [Neolentinus lepideus HHB14362 ss-1]